MNVAFGISRHVKIDNQSNVFHIKSSRRHICRHQYLSFSCFKSIESRLSFSLCHITIQQTSFEFISNQNLVDRFSVPLGMGKNQYFIMGICFNEFDNIIELLFMVYSKISMMYFVYGDSLTYLDKLITRDMCFDDSFHLIIHSSRKSKRLFYIFEVRPNFCNITDKSHIEHSIYLIQNKVVCSTDINDFLIHKIHKPSRSCNDNSRIFFENIFLDKRTRSTIKTSKTDAIKFSQVSYFFSYLDNKFSSRSENQCL